MSDPAPTPRAPDISEFVRTQFHIPRFPILFLERSPFEPGVYTDTLKALLELYAHSIEGLVTGHHLVNEHGWAAVNPTQELDFHYTERYGRVIERFYSHWMREWAKSPITMNAAVLIIEPDPTHQYAAAVWAGEIRPKVSGNYPTRRDVSAPLPKEPPHLCVTMEAKFRFDEAADITRAEALLKTLSRDDSVADPVEAGA